MRLERITVVEVKHGGAVITYKAWQPLRKEDAEQKASRLRRMKERLK